MKTFSTYIKAINPNTGELCTFSGTPIQAPSKQWAREYCDNSGIGWGYLFIGDELVETIPCKQSTDCVADFEHKVDYYTANQN